jgi:hypothetical protein
VDREGFADGSNTPGEVFWIALNAALCCGVTTAFGDCARRLRTGLPQCSNRFLVDDL